jgi:predicted nuclease of predicted toxin-antitoxin system
MNLLADESIDRQIVERLRQDGSALLITADKDFGELVFREGRLSAGGVVLFRLVGLSSARKDEIVADAFRKHGVEFPNCFSVISPERIRIRRKS